MNQRKTSVILRWHESSDGPHLNPTAGGFELTAGTLEQIQAGARKLASFGVIACALEGDGWELERQWAFHQGFWSPRKGADIDYAPLPDTQAAELQHRIENIDWARRLINESAETLGPRELATQVAKHLHQLAPDAVTYSILEGEQLARDGYVGLWSVGRGSDRPPVLLTLDYNPEETEAVDIALVGKGITFDSGGYSLKSNEGMFTMRMDMGGAATVSGALALAIRSGLRRHIRLILCCAENLISGRAYKLGDVLTYRNGTSVEIANTDAEGRLVLADGLIDASDTGAPVIIDAATLTGAAVVAVGTDYNAVFALDEDVRENYLACARETGERHWPLPLEPFHRDACKSSFADTMNSRPVKGGGAAGASNAAGFLSRFVRDNGKGWLHLDLAASDASSGSRLWAEGGTGHGIRTLANFLQRR